MPQFLVSYDLKSTYPDPHSAFLNAAESLGWYRYVRTSQGIVNKLPNTTLLGNFTDIGAAEATFDAVVTKARAATTGSVIVEKYILTAAPNTISQSDEHK